MVVIFKMEVYAHGDDYEEGDGDDDDDDRRKED